jgi:hypothetical protein
MRKLKKIGLGFVIFLTVVLVFMALEYQKMHTEQSGTVKVDKLDKLDLPPPDSAQRKSY